MIDWDEVTAEAVALLREYIRIDTSNPPGNEEPAAAFLAEVLADEGIVAEIADSSHGRANLFARIGTAGPSLCLLSHTDVVPVEREFWNVEPFGGELRDGMVWGRGALDMKTMGILELMTMILLKREGIELGQPVTFLATADEEAGSEFGMTWVAENRPQWLDASLVINEGAYGLRARGGAQAFQVAPAEKSPLWVRLKVRGRPGHGSIPHGDNCAEHLVHALERITRWERELRLTPVIRANLRAMSAAGLAQFSDDAAAFAEAERSPALRARMSNTVTVTTISTGIKVNVIPAEASATLDCRLLPDADPQAFLEELRGVLADDRIEIEVLNRWYPGAESAMDCRFIEIVREVVSDLVEGAQLAPEMTSGFTDSRITRLRGIPSYGFVPCLVDPEDLAGIHGHNEHISVENIRLGLQVLYEVVKRLVAA